jgi:hypothetical protein
MKNMVFCVAIGGSPAFHWSILPPSSGSKNKPSKKPAKAGRKLSQWPAYAGFLLGLFFNPQDASNGFLKNITLSPDHTVSQTRRLYSNRHKNLKFNRDSNH